MSMHRKPIAVAIVAAIASLVLAACGGDDDGSSGEQGEGNGEEASATTVEFTGSVESDLPTSYPDPEPADLKIGLLSPSQMSEIVTAQFDPAVETVEELGGEAILLDAQQDPDRQVSQFQQLLNEKVDAIGVVPIADPKLLQPLLERAAEAKIPVVGIEVTPGMTEPVPGFASQVWQARDRMAYLQVRAAAEELGSGAKIGRVNFALPVPLFEYFKERQEFWAEEFGLEIVDEVNAESDAIDSTQQAATGLVAGNRDMTGILGFVAEAAIGASLAAREAGRDDVRAFGVNAVSAALEAIKSGRLAATVKEDAAAIGIEFAKGLYDAAQGVEIPPVVVPGEQFIVTEENVEEASG